MPVQSQVKLERLSVKLEGSDDGGSDADSRYPHVAQALREVVVLRDEVEDLREQLHTAERVRQELTEELNNLSEEHDQRIEEIVEERDAAQTEANELYDKAQALEADKALLESSLAISRNSNVIHQQRIAQLQSANEGLSHQVAALEEQQDDYENTVTQLQNGHGVLQTNVNILSAERDALLARVKELERLLPPDELTRIIGLCQARMAVFDDDGPYPHPPIHELKTVSAGNVNLWTVLGAHPVAQHFLNSVLFLQSRTTFLSDGNLLAWGPRGRYDAFTNNWTPDVGSDLRAHIRTKKEVFVTRPAPGNTTEVIYLGTFAVMDMRSVSSFKRIGRIPEGVDASILLSLLASGQAPPNFQQIVDHHYRKHGGGFSSAIEATGLQRVGFNWALYEGLFPGVRKGSLKRRALPVEEGMQQQPWKRVRM
ncbi:hypothetical protein HMN09_00926000 [Mycena chlorophos]|uniref:Uncharacterized protein n=1 Tax=Mycena chlorophos TaxID=658473 RepID=A0A8H6W3J7_MYCCL|nr:hypothetical protein HMN09_00926000 [Mycena chlorophos]